MRRWFAVLLLVLLPLQFSWAAVAAYCQHEPEGQPTHLGHHEHRHDGAEASKAGAEKSALPQVDLDCAQCHAYCAALPVVAAPALPLWQATRPPIGEAALRAPAAAERPERPQWACLA
jgi:hypothetical protein